MVAPVTLLFLSSQSCRPVDPAHWRLCSRRALRPAVPGRADPIKASCVDSAPGGGSGQVPGRGPVSGGVLPRAPSDPPTCVKNGEERRDKGFGCHWTSFVAVLCSGRRAVHCPSCLYTRAWEVGAVSVGLGTGRRRSRGHDRGIVDPVDASEPGHHPRRRSPSTCKIPLQRRLCVVGVVPARAAHPCTLLWQ